MAKSVQYNDPTPNNFPNNYDTKDVDMSTELSARFKDNYLKK